MALHQSVSLSPASMFPGLGSSGVPNFGAVR